MQKGLTEYLFYFLEIINRRKWVLILFCFIVIVYTVFTTYRTIPLYKAEAQVESPPNTMLISGKEQEFNYYKYYAERATYYRNEVIFLQSPELLARAFSELPADVQGYLNRESKGNYLSRIKANLMIGRLEETDIFTATFVDPDPGICAAVANGIVDTYLVSIIDRFKEQKERVYSSVGSSMIPQIEEDLKTKKEEKIKFLSDLGFSDIKESNNAKITKWKEILNSISSVENELLELNTKKEHVLNIKNLDEKYLEVATIIAKNDSSPLISKLLEERSALLYEYDNLKRRYKDKWPAVVEVKGKLEVNERALISEVMNYVDGINSQADFLASRLGGLNEERLKLETEIGELNKKLLKLDNLNSEIATLTSQYQYYQGLRSEAGISRNIDLPTARWIQKASVPGYPFKPDVKMNMIVGLLVALTGGIGLCFLFDSMDSSIRYPEELEKVFGSMIVGVIPFMKTKTAVKKGKRSRSPVVIQKSDSNAFEALRKLRTEITFYMQKHNAKVFSVLSSSPLEGKTTVALNIAYILSLDKKRVLLIDADLRRPTLHNVAIKDPGDALIHYLKERINVEQLITPTLYDNVHVVATRSYFSDSPEILSGNKFNELLEYGRKNFDVVIVDTPPLLSLTDGGIVAKLTDASFIVVRENFTKRIYVYSTQKHMNNLNINLAGIVMNCVQEKRSYYYYYYYYSYYYNRYYSKYGYGQEDAKKLGLKTLSVSGSGADSEESGDDGNEPPIVIT